MSCLATRRSSTPARCFLAAPVACTSSGGIEIGGERLHGVVDVAARRARSRPFSRAAACRRRRNRRAARRAGPCRRPARWRRGRPWRSRRGGGRIRRSRRASPCVAAGTRIAVSTSLRPERGLEQALEEIVGLDRALAVRPGDLDLAAERQQAGRQFGRRIGEGDRAADACRGCGSRRGRCAAWRARSAARASAMSAERSASAWRVSAPISTMPFFTAMPASPPTPLRSIRSFGADSRMLSVAIRLWPPASSRASPSGRASSSMA